MSSNLCNSNDKPFAFNEMLLILAFSDWYICGSIIHDLNFYAQEVVGNVGGKLHTGRSRNDQVFS